MQLQLKIQMNPGLFLRDPESTELGRTIVSQGIRLIEEIGIEDFTFKKLAAQVGTTEASVYRYFENKHRLLTYIITWFYTWMEYQLHFHTNNVKDPAEKIDMVIDLLLFKGVDEPMEKHIDRQLLQRIVIAESNKAYFTKQVEADNRALIFKPYKDLCQRIAELFLDYRPGFKYAHSLGSTLIETANHQFFFKDHLPRLTDFGKEQDTDGISGFLRHLVFSALNS